jgi:hypothetical protein
MYRKDKKAKILLFILFFMGILLTGIVISIAFFPPCFNIQSHPANASIYINCLKRNLKTPAHIRSLTFFGRHRVVVSKNGYQPHIQDVSFSLFRRTINIDAKLEKEIFSSGDNNIVVGWVDGSRYPTVKVMVKVKDETGKLIPDLKKENIKVIETREERCLEVQPDFNLQGVSKVDMVFFIDVTGSMGGALDICKQNIEAFCDLLQAENLNFRLAGYSFEDIVPYKDKFQFTTEFTDQGSAREMVKEFKEWLASLKAEGGGDGNENCLDPIIDASDGGLAYRTDATRIGILITDTSAHVAGDGGDSHTTATFEKTRAKMKSMGIKLYYASPQKEYEMKLNAQSLGWPFSTAVLTEIFSEELIGWYAITFNDQIPVEKNMARRCILSIKRKSQQPGKPEEYIKNFVFYPWVH